LKIQQEIPSSLSKNTEDRRLTGWKKKLNSTMGKMQILQKTSNATIADVWATPKSQIPPN